MDNPQDCLPIRTMYSYSTHNNKPWESTFNYQEYQPQRQYLQPDHSNPKSPPLAPKPGKRGFYLDYHVKIMKEVPAANKYKQTDSWDQTQNKKHSELKKINPSLKKQTYIDKIEMEQKHRKKPGPGSYNLVKSQAQIKKEQQELRSKKPKPARRNFFYEDTEFLSAQQAGMGAYNPHFFVPRLRVNKTNLKFWKAKHLKQSLSQRKKLGSKPSPGSYTARAYGTFDRIQSASAERKKDIPSHGFGTDSRFPYNRPDKKIIQEERPGPNSYNMIIHWKDKNDSSKGKSWFESRSLGTSKSLYHER